MINDYSYWNDKDHSIFMDYSKGKGSWKRKFRTLIWSFHEKNRREFSWRNSITPWRVLVSEFMLQQTQTSRVKDKFPLFIKSFPSVKACAEANLEDVLGLWSGLGYNRRALNLHKAATRIRNDHKGRVPNKSEELLSLPGIGSSTAAAIRVFAFNIPDTIIETNIRTVFRKVFLPLKSDISDALLLPLIQETIDTENAREWFYGLMDYGAFHKRNGYQVNPIFKGYQKQSSFEGSKRQIRGEVIRFVLENKRVSSSKVYEYLQSEFRRDLNEIASICDDLNREGLLKKNRNHFFIS